MRFHDRSLCVQWAKGVKRPEKSNAMDMLCSGQVGAELSEFERQDYERNFAEGQVPSPFTPEERREWLGKLSEVAVSSDAFVSLSFSYLRIFPISGRLSFPSRASAT